MTSTRARSGRSLISSAAQAATMLIGTFGIAPGLIKVKGGNFVGNLEAV